MLANRVEADHASFESRTRLGRRVQRTRGAGRGARAERAVRPLDVNLGAYVGNDPINHRDPDGESCARNADTGNYSCKVDFVEDKGKIRAASAADHKRYAAFERAYSRAVNRLMSNPNRVAIPVIPGKGSPNSRGFVTTSAEVGTALIGRNVIAAPNVTSMGNALMVSPKQGTYVFRDGLEPGRTIFGSASRSIQVYLVHEGIHGVLGERLMPIAPLLGTSPYREAHQEPYNRAAEILLGPGD